jgi:zinc transport system substrate-binding protein
MHRIVLYFFLLGILSAPAQLASAEPYLAKLKVLSSIKPIQAIVVAIGGEHIDSDQLIPDFISPHDYSFKPSDIKKIKKADLIFRIDEHFETMLNTVFENLPDESKIISLAENPNIKLLPATGEHQHGSAEHDHADMHIFTSPKNALIMAQEITIILSKADAKNAVFYNKNLQIFHESIAKKTAEIKDKLEPFKNTPYVVFHNSWQYFGEYFGLQKPTVIELHEGVSTGVKSIMAIRREIAKNKISCIFSEPSISVRRVNILLENQRVKTENIDVMGHKIQLGQDSYMTWLEIMGEQIGRCLSH